MILENVLKAQKIRDVATKPAKREQINENPTNQFLTEKKSIAHTEKARSDRDSNP